MKKLITTNPDCMTYKHSGIKITVLGGVRLDGLDRMRTTLKLEYEQEAIRHNLDLYNDTQLVKLTRRAAERMEIGTSVVTKVLGDLITELEDYRIEQLSLRKVERDQTKVLTEEEITEATTFLQSNNLLEQTNKLIGRSGVIGEETNRLLMYLIFTSRKTNRPLHVVSLGASGMGKTHLQESVANLIPQEDKIEITSLSENAFYYFERRELVHKLMLIEDLDGAENVLYPLRELQSKRKISKTIVQKNTQGETKTVHLVVDGPVCVSGCTTKERIYEDNANRSFLVYLDESTEQDQRIMNYQRSLSAGSISTAAEDQAAELLRNCQRILKPVKVINPYAELLFIPTEVFKPRRTNNHYLQFIEALTFYHQFQRERKVDTQTGEEYIETTLEDIAEANKLMKHVLLRKSDQLSGACRNHFEHLKLYLIGEQKKQFTNQNISLLFRASLTSVKRYHLELLRCSYLKMTKKKGSKEHWYEVVSYEEYQELQKRVDTVLDDCLSKLKEELAANLQHNQPPTTSKKEADLRQKQPPTTSKKEADLRQKQPQTTSKQTPNNQPQATSKKAVGLRPTSDSPKAK